MDGSSLRQSLGSKVHQRTVSRLLLLIVLSYLVRLVLLVQPNVIHTDGAQYATIGENLFAGNGFRGIYTGGAVDVLSSPLYPILVGGTDLIIGNLHFSAHLVSYIFGGVIVVPTYLLAARIYDSRIALIAGLFVVFQPDLIRFANEATVESLYAFLLVSSIYVGFRAHSERSMRLYALVGLLLGLGFLTKPETIGYIGLFAVASIGASLYLNGVNRPELQRQIAKSSVSVLVFLLVIAPFVISLYLRTGTFTLGGKSGVNIVIAEYVTSNDPLAYERIVYGLTPDGNLRTTIWNETGPSVLVYILNHISEMTLRVVLNLKKFYQVLIPRMLPALMLGLVAIGLSNSRSSKRQVAQTLGLLVVLVYPIASYSLFFIRVRHLVPFVPIFLVWAAAGTPKLTGLVADFSQLFTERITRRQLRSAVVGLVIVSLLVPSGFMFSTSGPLEQKEAGEWLQTNTDEDASVTARKPMAAFYGDRTYWQLPFASYEAIISFARDRGIDYLLLSERYTEQNRPQLAFLLNESASVPPELDKVYADTDGSDVYIYEIESPSNTTS